MRYSPVYSYPIKGGDGGRKRGREGRRENEFVVCWLLTIVNQGFGKEMMAWQAGLIWPAEFAFTIRGSTLSHCRFKDFWVIRGFSKNPCESWCGLSLKCLLVPFCGIPTWVATPLPSSKFPKILKGPCSGLGSYKILAFSPAPHPVPLM